MTIVLSASLPLFVLAVYLFLRALQYLFSANIKPWVLGLVALLAAILLVVQGASEVLRR